MAIITTKGIELLSQASADINKFTPKKFKFSADDVDISPSLISSDINTWIESEITYLDFLDNSTLQITCEILPDKATSSVKTVGVYDDNDTLLIVHKLNNALPQGIKQTVIMTVTFTNIKNCNIDVSYISSDKNKEGLVSLNNLLILGNQITKNTLSLNRLAIEGVGFYPVDYYINSNDMIKAVSEFIIDFEIDTFNKTKAEVEIFLSSIDLILKKTLNIKNLINTINNHEDDFTSNLINFMNLDETKIRPQNDTSTIIYDAEIIESIKNKSTQFKTELPSFLDTLKTMHENDFDSNIDIFLAKFKLFYYRQIQYDENIRIFIENNTTEIEKFYSSIITDIQSLINNFIPEEKRNYYILEEADSTSLKLKFDDIISSFVKYSSIENMTDIDNVSAEIQNKFETFISVLYTILEGKKASDPYSSLTDDNLLSLKTQIRTYLTQYKNRFSEIELIQIIKNNFDFIKEYILKIGQILHTYQYINDPQTGFQFTYEGLTKAIGVVFDFNSLDTSNVFDVMNTIKQQLSDFRDKIISEIKTMVPQFIPTFSLSDQQDIIENFNRIKIEYQRYILNSVILSIWTNYIELISISDDRLYIKESVKSALENYILMVQDFIRLPLNTQLTLEEQQALDSLIKTTTDNILNDLSLEDASYFPSNKEEFLGKIKSLIQKTKNIINI